MNIIYSILVFIVGWVVILVSSLIFGIPGESQDAAAILFSVLYLGSVITFFCLKIIDILKDINEQLFKKK